LTQPSRGTERPQATSLRGGLIIERAKARWRRRRPILMDARRPRAGPHPRRLSPRAAPRNSLIPSSSQFTDTQLRRITGLGGRLILFAGWDGNNELIVAAEQFSAPRERNNAMPLSRNQWRRGGREAGIRSRTIYNVLPFIRLRRRRDAPSNHRGRRLSITQFLTSQRSTKIRQNPGKGVTTASQSQAAEA
jgi:hypothetical protein